MDIFVGHYSACHIFKQPLHHLGACRDEESGAPAQTSESESAL